MHEPLAHNQHPIDRRAFVTGLAAMGAATLAIPALARSLRATGSADTMPYKISLAEWSLHRTLFDGKLDHLDFAKTAKEKYGIDAVEYVNAFFKDKATDAAYLEEMNTRCRDHGVKSLLIMVDGEGAIGAPDKAEREQTVENHRKWLDAAKILGCHSIRVNAQSEGEFEEQQKLAADGLARLTEFAEPLNLNVIVENHGGYSSHGGWLAGVMKLVDRPRCGTLPDFGNFCMDWGRVEEPDAWYDRYKGVKEMMPFAKAVSAKSRAFDEKGEETGTDYRKMMKIVADAGYKGYVGIEWEGNGISEHEGIVKTKRLLETVRDEMA